MTILDRLNVILNSLSKQAELLMKPKRGGSIMFFPWRATDSMPNLLEKGWVGTGTETVSLVEAARGIGDPFGESPRDYDRKALYDTSHLHERKYEAWRHS